MMARALAALALARGSCADEAPPTQQADPLVGLIEAALLGPQPRLASAFHDMHRAQPLDHRGASGKRSEHVAAFAAESRSDAKVKYVVVANTAASELDDPVRISVEDLGLKPYLVPGDTGPQLNALSGRSYFVTDLYTNVTFPIGAGLLGAPKPRGSSSYIVREMPCNESLQYACSRRAEEEVHPYDGTLHPLFHLPAGNQPGYTGDPNGIMYREDTGLFHLFWQCTPERSTSGDFWCHSVSKDYVRWKQLPHALPSGCESGGATQLPNGDVVVVFQHNHQTPIGAIHMEARPLNLSDPLLLDWGVATVQTGGKDGVGGSDISPAWRSAEDGQWLFATGGATMSVTPSVYLWNTSSFRKYGAKGPLHTYKFDRCYAYGGNAHYCGYGSYARDPNFFGLNSSDHDNSDGVRVLEVLQKTCESSGRDFYVLGNWEAKSFTFTPLDPVRDVGVAVFDFGNFLASETVWDPPREGKPGRRIITAFAFEGDCDSANYPMTCPWSGPGRGWGSVILLPRVLHLDGFVDDRGVHNRMLRTPPLPELSKLRSKSVHVRKEAMHVGAGETVLVPTPKDLGNSYEVRAVFELPGAELDAQADEQVDTAAKENYDFGLQLLWARDDSEYTKVGVRSTAKMPGVDLVSVADSRGVDGNLSETVVLPRYETKHAEQAAKACKMACDDADNCVAWTARPGANASFPMSAGNGSASHWRCAMHKTYPLHSTTEKSAQFAPYTLGSVSGFMPQKELHFASMYVNREKSSYDVIGSGGGSGGGDNGTLERSYTKRYGHFEYSGTLWLKKKTDRTVVVNAFVDRSVVEYFGQEGRGAITARVYPTTAPRDMQIGIYSDGGAVKLKSIDVWQMGSTRLEEPPL